MQTDVTPELGDLMTQRVVVTLNFGGHCFVWGMEVTVRQEDPVAWRMEIAFGLEALTV